MAKLWGVVKRQSFVQAGVRIAFFSNGTTKEIPKMEDSPRFQAEKVGKGGEERSVCGLMSKGEAVRIASEMNSAREIMRS